ncbi:MAG TPA: PspC domain-containing protein, partial [Sphingomicrobium sp.]
MVYDRYPAPEERSNRPQERSSQPQYVTEHPVYSQQPASRTRFYRDKRNGKLCGVCAGIADYTGFDVALVRICFLAAMFMSGGGVLPFYFIAAVVAPTKPEVFERVDREEQQFWQGVRASPARATRDIRSRL